MKRTEYSFGKIDFNGSRAVIPTNHKKRLRIVRFSAFFSYVTIATRFYVFCYVDITKSGVRL